MLGSWVRAPNGSQKHLIARCFLRLIGLSPKGSFSASLWKRLLASPSASPKRITKRESFGLFFRSSFFAPHPFKGRGPGKGGGVLKLLSPPLASRTPPLRWEGSSPSPFGEGVEGVEGVLTCGVVGLYGCAFECDPHRTASHQRYKKTTFCSNYIWFTIFLVIICTFAPEMVSTIRKMKEIWKKL